MVVFKYFLLIFTIKIILSNPSLAMQIEDGDNAAKTLHQAIRFGNIAVIKSLCGGKGFDVDATVDHTKRTALHRAVIEGKREAVKLLISLGANLSCEDYCGWTPFQHAAAGGNREVMEELINQVEVSLSRRAKETQLQGPQREDFLNQGRYYLINGKNHHGQTPLHLAIVTARFTEKELIFLLGKLVRMRVDLTEKDNKGKTPYDYALNVGYHRLAHRIDELGNNKVREK